MEVRDEEMALIGFLDNYSSDDSNTVIAVTHSNERVVHSNERVIQSNERVIQSNERVIHSNERVIHRNDIR